MTTGIVARVSWPRICVVCVEQRQQQHELVCLVVTLRVLGKFLGYVDFMSYHTNELLISTVSQLAVSTRHQVSTYPH